MDFLLFPHPKTCRSPASGSRTRPHAFAQERRAQARLGVRARSTRKNTGIDVRYFFRTQMRQDAPHCRAREWRWRFWADPTENRVHGNEWVPNRTVGKVAPRRTAVAT